MRLAVLADIHGNIHALQAIATRLEQIQPDAVVVVGDIINAVPFSREVIDFVQRQDWIIIRGNHEFYYLDFASGRAPAAWQDAERWGQLHWLVEHISPEQGNYLASLPDELMLCFPGTEPLRITHGLPGVHRWGFNNSMPASSIADKLTGVSQETFINAHSHLQIDRLVRERSNGEAEVKNNDPFFEEKPSPEPPRTWHVINPGSAGLPLNGDVRAQFAVLESVSPQSIPGGWRVSHHRVPYDRRPALAAYTERGMLQAGGVISEVFYWELVTGLSEISLFFRWVRKNMPENDATLREEFEAYKAATGREAYIRERHP